ncbi:MAG: glycosyltransferase family 4 protein [Bacteroidetes bacterium]|nr:glycosyltransferase family 4 protein [Bacteroidota bacterium]
MFKVLVIAYYFPPMGLSGVQRTLKFTKYLKEYNWRPTVLTSGKTGYYAHDLSLLKEAEDAEIEIVRTEAFDLNSMLANFGTIKMPSEKIRKLLSLLSKTFLIPDNKISWSIKAYKKAKELLSKEKFDAIYITLPPFSPFTIASRLKKEFNLPLIVDYRDLWYGNHFAFYPTPYHKFRHKKQEEMALRSTDHVIAVNRKIKEHLLTTYKFLSFENITIIPHGFDPADFNNIKPVFTENDKIKVLYTGIFYESITPKYLFKAFRELSIERPDIAENYEFHFIGYLRKENMNLVKQLGLEAFIFDHGYMDHKEVVRYISYADFLWVMLNDEKNMQMVSAGKLFEYFGTKKPILATVPEGASRTAATQYSASYITDPRDITAIKNALIKMRTDFINGNIPSPNDEFVLTHDRKFLTKQLAQILQFNVKETE